MEYLVCFNYKIIYVKGINNLVVDAMLRYFHSDWWNKKYDLSEHIDTDIRLDLDHKDLPIDHWEEIYKMSMVGKREKKVP